VCNSGNKNKEKCLKTTVLLDVNQSKYFGLLGHHQVAKFYDTKYCLCVVEVEILSSGQKQFI